MKGTLALVLMILSGGLARKLEPKDLEAIQEEVDRLQKIIPIVEEEAVLEDMISDLGKVIIMSWSSTLQISKRIRYNLIFVQSINSSWTDTRQNLPTFNLTVPEIDVM